MTLRYPPLRYRTTCQDDGSAAARGLRLGTLIGAAIWAVFFACYFIVSF